MSWYAVLKLFVIGYGHGVRDWTRTVFLRGDDEAYTMTTRGRLLERVRVTLAGRAAEEAVLGNPTTYSVIDLRVRASPDVLARDHEKVVFCGVMCYVSGQSHGTSLTSQKPLL